MVLKEVRRVNAGSVAKRQQLRSNANARKAEEEARATEQVLAAAWSVGADSRRQQRDAEAEAKARQKDARDDLKLSALRAESELTGDAPRIVNRKLQIYLMRRAEADAADDPHVQWIDDAGPSICRMKKVAGKAPAGRGGVIPALQRMIAIASPS